MTDLVHSVQNGIMYACIAVLALICSVVLAVFLRRSLGIVRRSLSGVELAVFAVLAGVACWAAQKRLVSYPRTDPTQTYLSDLGSWVDGDLVHIEFSRIIVPDSATMFVDRQERGVENADWVQHIVAPFRDIRLPLEFSYPEATNFNWIVYTDWTPGPTVQTNGVWHAMWGKDHRTGAHMIPLRTAVRVDGETIATPKSREDSSHE